MPKPLALIAWGGWEGHYPFDVAELSRGVLVEAGWEVELREGTSCFLEVDLMSKVSLVVPVITMGRISDDECKAITHAVSERGVGIAGCHGGMCDAFRESTEWQFMTGGQFVAHPGDTVTYSVEINRDVPHPITAGIPDFEVTTEQYYMHVDPGNTVLAHCNFPTIGANGPHTGNPCRMPQVWTKMYGRGRVFYNALGHDPAVLSSEPCLELMRRGFSWAARGQ